MTNKETKPNALQYIYRYLGFIVFWAFLVLGIVEFTKKLITLI